MSFYISFFARDVYSAQAKLREAYAPTAVKALIELAIASVPHESSGGAGSAGNVATGTGAQLNKTPSNAPARPRLAGILVETSGHIDDQGQRSWIDKFRVEPYYD